jgi:hypothetical protein
MDDFSNIQIIQLACHLLRAPVGRTSASDAKSAVSCPPEKQKNTKQMKTSLRKHLMTACIVGGFLTPSAMAGSFILAGTDADDHGFADIGGNQDGWLFMQKSLENIAPGVTNGNKVITVLGSSGNALTAASSAFNLSTLVGAGWSLQVVDGDANLTSFFNGTAAFNINNAGILMMDSGGNVGGGATLSERGVFTTNATVIDSFLGAGGGLFSQSNGYGWVSALLPTLGVVNQSQTGLALTADGSSAFPGLNNGDLSAGPWHNSFTNVGSLPILATSTTASTFGAPVILGAFGGSVTQPKPPSVPDSGSTLALMFGSIGSMFAGCRLLKSKRKAS